MLAQRVRVTALRQRHGTEAPMAAGLEKPVRRFEAVGERGVEALTGGVVIPRPEQPQAFGERPVPRCIRVLLHARPGCGFLDDRVVGRRRASMR